MNNLINTDTLKKLKSSFLIKLERKNKIVDNWDAYDDEKKENIINVIDEIIELEKKIVLNWINEDNSFVETFKFHISKSMVKVVKLKEDNDNIDEIEKLLDDL